MPKKICHAHVSSLKHHHHITAPRPSPLPLSMTIAPMMTMWILGTPPSWYYPRPGRNCPPSSCVTGMHWAPWTRKTGQDNLTLWILLIIIN